MNKKHGWLTNKSRRERRDRTGTLSDFQVEELIRKIEVMTSYTKLATNFDILIRLRDKCLIALAWIFFKRANEVFNVRLADLFYDDKQLSVTFHISKKGKSFKICLKCSDRNAKRAGYCKKCGENISQVPSTNKPRIVVVVKNKSIQYPFCKYVIEWVEKMKELKLNKEVFLFPRYKRFVGLQFSSENHLTVQRFDQILQRLDPTIASSFFRYGHTEKLLRLGYTPYDLKEIGDWDSSHMPEIYASRKGLTPSQKRFTEDIRTG